MNEDGTVEEITPERGTAVPMPADERGAWMAAHLFHSPESARRLLDAAESAWRGDVTEFDLDRD